MPALVIPPPARMGLLVAAKYARKGYAIRRAVWHGGVTLQTPTPTTEQIAAAHVLAWVTYARGLYTYAEPVSGVRRVAQSLDALLSDYAAADWTTLVPVKDNDDILSPPVPATPTSGGGVRGGSGGGSSSSSDGSGIDGGGGVGDGSREHDCGQGMYWDGTQCRRIPKQNTQPTLSLAAVRVGDPDCTDTDPITNHFGATVAVNEWSGAKPGDIWFITIRWGTPEGMMTGARGAKVVGAPLDDARDIAAHPGQRFKVFATAWLPGSHGLTVSASEWVNMQARCTETTTTTTTTSTTTTPPPDYIVYFSANGGTGTMPPQVGTAPSALDANAFTRTGYTFTGWNTAADGSGTAYTDGGTYGFVANATMYAQWTEDGTTTTTTTTTSTTTTTTTTTTPPPGFTVTFDSNGGTGTMPPQSGSSPAPLDSNTFTWTGFTFAGWNTAADGSGTAYADGGTYPFDADATLFAQWI